MMHAPAGLLILAAVLGVLMPVGVGMLTVPMEPAMALVLRIISLAVVPVVIARIAYRQGYDRASSSER